MRLTIEIAAAALLLFCISASSAAFAAGKTGRSADGLSCSFSVPANASPAARCAAITRQCGGKFYANYCGGQDAVGDVRSELHSLRVVPAKAGTHNQPLVKAGGQIAPVEISVFDRFLHLPIAVPILQLLLARDRVHGDANVSTWTRRCTPYFLTNSRAATAADAAQADPKIVGNADVKRSVPAAGENVDVVCAAAPIGCAIFHER